MMCGLCANASVHGQLGRRLTRDCQQTRLNIGPTSVDIGPGPVRARASDADHQYFLRVILDKDLFAQRDPTWNRVPG